MRTLEYNPDSHNAREYKVDVKLVHRTGMTLPTRAKLMRDYAKVGDGIYWLMSGGVYLAATQSKKDAETVERLAEETEIEDGEIVLIEEEKYLVKVLGPYSNCAVLEKIV